MSTPEERQRARDRAADACDLTLGLGSGRRPNSNPPEQRRERAMPSLEKCKYCPREIKPGTPMEAHLRASHPHTVGPQSRPPSPEPETGGVMWEDPPGALRGKALLFDKIRKIIPDLKRNPGRWARVHDYDGPTSANTSATPAKREFTDLEIIGRKVDGGSAIFARYVEEA